MTLRIKYVSLVQFKCHILYVHIIQVLRKLYETFSGVWHDLGYSWDDCMEWMVTRHIPSMQIIHVEVNYNYNLYSILSIVDNLDQPRSQCNPPICHRLDRLPGRLGVTEKAAGLHLISIMFNSIYHAGGKDLQIEASKSIQGEGRRSWWILPGFPSRSSLAIF